MNNLRFFIEATLKPVMDRIAAILFTTVILTILACWLIPFPTYL